MKIVLINAPIFQEQIQPVMALFYLKSQLKKEGFDAETYDINNELLKEDKYKFLKKLQKEFISMFYERRRIYDINIQKLLSLLYPEYFPIEIEQTTYDELKKNIEEKTQKILVRKPDVLGFSIKFSNIYYSSLIAKRIKEINPKIKIIFGGPGCENYISNNILLKTKICDYIIIGEGEETLTELCKNVKEKKDCSNIEGIWYLNKNKVINNPARRLIRKLDDLQFPEIDENYNEIITFFDDSGINQKNVTYHPIITSRGCVNKCTYCSETSFWKAFRQRSVDNVIEEIMEIKNKGISHFEFHDSLLNGSRKWIDEFSQKVIDLNLDITWSGEARCENLDSELLNKMRKAGCISLCLGIESFSNKMLSIMRKNVTKEKIEEIVPKINNANIRIIINIIYGFPFEERKDFLENIYGLINLYNETGKIFPINPQVFHLMRNTYIYNNLEKYEIKIKNSHIKVPSELDFLKEDVAIIPRSWDSNKLVSDKEAEKWFIIIKSLSEFCLKQHGRINNSMINMDNLKKAKLSDKKINHIYITFKENDLKEDNCTNLLNFLEECKQKNISIIIPNALPFCIIKKNQSFFQNFQEEIYTSNKIFKFENGFVSVSQRELNKILHPETHEDINKDIYPHRKCENCEFRLKNMCQYAEEW